MELFIQPMVEEISFLLELSLVRVHKEEESLYLLEYCGVNWATKEKFLYTVRSRGFGWIHDANRSANETIVQMYS